MWNMDDFVDNTGHFCLLRRRYPAGDLRRHPAGERPRAEVPRPCRRR
jgi:hypothetical protein